VARLLAAVVVLAAAALLSLFFWPELLGLQRVLLFAHAVTLRGAAAAAALAAALAFTVIALAAVRTRRFFASLAIICLLFTAGSTAVLVDRGFGGPGFPTKGENDLTVLAWNTLGDSVSVDEIATLAVESDADIVSLPETTEPIAEAVAAQARAAGLPLVAWTFAYDEVAKARSTSLLISSELGSFSDTESGVTAVLPSVVATSTSGGPTIVAVHAIAPVRSEMDTWRSDLAALAELCQDPNVILAGDFNATLDSFAGFGTPMSSADGSALIGDLGACLDAANVAGAAAVGTWPSGFPALFGTPIDHVLATPNWRTTGFRVIGDRDEAGSDHRPVLAQLTPAG